MKHAPHEVLGDCREFSVELRNEFIYFRIAPLGIKLLVCIYHDERVDLAWQEACRLEDYVPTHRVSNEHNRVQVKMFNYRRNVCAE